MSAKIINGNKIANKILTNLQLALSAVEGSRPKLAVIFVGTNKPSQTYINKKRLACKKVGINFQLYKFPTKITERQLLTELAKIQTDPHLTGLIVQLPIPKHLHTQTILDAVQPKFDVDCLNSSYLKNLEDLDNLATLKALPPPPPPPAILEILRTPKVDLKNKKIIIIGQGRLVGKPLVAILHAIKIKPIACDKYTKDIPTKCRQADIVITATGQKDLIRGNMIKPGAIVIDAGVSFVNKKMFGDINFAEVKKIASAVTPTPGGVGPITVAMLLKNVYEASRHHSNI